MPSFVSRDVLPFACNCHDILNFHLSRSTPVAARASPKGHCIARPSDRLFVFTVVDPRARSLCPRCGRRFSSQFGLDCFSHAIHSVRIGLLCFRCVVCASLSPDRASPWERGSLRLLLV